MSGDRWSWLCYIRYWEKTMPEDELVEEDPIAESLYDPIQNLPLPTRVRNALLRGGMRTVNDLLATSEEEIRDIWFVGEMAFGEIKTIRDRLLASLSSLDTPSNLTVEGAVGANEGCRLVNGFRDSGGVTVSLSDSILVLPLSSRAQGALRDCRVRTIDGLLRMPERKLRSLNGVGTKTFREIQTLRNQLQSLLSLGRDDRLELKVPVPDAVADKLLSFGVRKIADLSHYTVEDLIVRGQLTYSEARHLEGILSATDVSLSTLWPEHPLVSSSDFRYLERMGIPLEDIRISRLALPERLEAELELLGMETVATVASQSELVLGTVLGALGEEYIRILARNLEAYFQWLTAQDNWDTEVSNLGISPLYFVQLGENTLATIVDGLFRHLRSERNRKVIRLRFGLDGGGQRTLQEIAEQFGLSRARIHQIEGKALSRLRSGRGAGLLQALYVSIEDEMRVRGGLMSLTQIGEYIDDILEIGEIDLDGSVLLLLSLARDPFVELQRKKRWGLKDTPQHLVKPATRELLAILQAVHAPLPQAVLVDRLTETEWYAELGDKDCLSREFIIACLSTDDRFEETEDSQWGLTRWRKHRIDEIVIALRQLGKPSHFTEIAKITNEMLPPSQRTSARNILSQMRHNSHLFVWVNRGTYGLAEWGLKRVRFYVDIAEEVLEEKGKPLTFEEIFRVVNAEREASPDSIKFILSTNPRFHLYPDNRFGLVSWLEEADEGEEDDTEDLFLEDLKRRLFHDF
jgi:DNA-directed RNA polymerase delta subunit